MIQKFVTKFDANRDVLMDQFKSKHPDSYSDIVKTLISVLSAGEDYGFPDPDRIHTIDDGDYQGTLVFVIAGKGYQPSDYWYVKVSYGSCSGCDTLQAIRGYGDRVPTESQAKRYFTLALHVMQGLKEMGDE